MPIAMSKGMTTSTSTDHDAITSASLAFERALAKVKALLSLAERQSTPEHEASSAAYLAGRKAQALGLECDDVWQHWGRTVEHTAPWCHFVDGWYDQLEGKERTT